MNVQGNYLYDINTGRTIAVRKGTSTEGRTTEGNFTLDPDYAHIEFDVLDSNAINSGNYCTVEQLSFEMLIELFSRGNLTADEFMIGINAKGCYIDGRIRSDGESFDILYQDKVYRVFCNKEAMESQLDDIVVDVETAKNNIENDEGERYKCIFSRAAFFFVYDYFGYEFPKSDFFNIRQLKPEEIEFVNEHPEIFHLRIDGGPYFGTTLDSYLTEIPLGQGNENYSYATGTYDMFGNGCPLGPEGSIPTGVDGIYIKLDTDNYYTSDDNARGITIYYYNAKTKSYDKVFHRTDMPLSCFALGFKYGHLNWRNPVEAVGGDEGMEINFNFYFNFEKSAYTSALLGYQQTSKDGIFYKNGKYYKFNEEFWRGSQGTLILNNIAKYEQDLFKEYTPTEDIEVYDKAPHIPQYETTGMQNTSVNNRISEEISEFASEYNVKTVGTCSDMSYQEYQDIVALMEFIGMTPPAWGELLILKEKNGDPDFRNWFPESDMEKLTEADFNKYKANLIKLDKNELIQLALKKLMNSPTLYGDVTVWDTNPEYGQKVMNPSLKRLLEIMGAESVKYEIGRDGNHSVQKPSYVSFTLGGNSYKIGLTPEYTYTYPETAVVTKEEVESLRNYVDEMTYQSMLYWFFTPLTTVNGEVQTYMLTFNYDILYYEKCAPMGLHAPVQQVLSPMTVNAGDGSGKYGNHYGGNNFTIDMDIILEYLKTHSVMRSPAYFSLSNDDYEMTEVYGVFINKATGEYELYEWEKGKVVLVKILTEEEYQELLPKNKTTGNNNNSRIENSVDEETGITAEDTEIEEGSDTEQESSKKVLSGKIKIDYKNLNPINTNNLRLERIKEFIKKQKAEIEKFEKTAEVKTTDDVVETDEIEEVEETDEVKKSINTEVIMTASDYKKRYEQEAKKLGLIRGVNGIFYKFEHGIKYNYIWNPQENKFEIFTTEQITKNTDVRIERIKMILAAISQGLNFTAIPNICKDDKGNTWYYDSKLNRFKIS